MRTLVVAPHPDDEILGMGGTLARKKREGNSLGWLIMTEIKTTSGWSKQRVAQRKLEINEINRLIGFDSVYQLHFQSKELDTIRLADIISKVSKAVLEFEPDEIFVPHPSDVHSDHKITYNAVISATKWFRNPTVRRILAYETLSETGVDPLSPQRFVPNYYVNIESDLNLKLEAIGIYSSEIGEFPFPRSAQAIEALARLRGAEAGFSAAEAFELIKEVS